MGKVNFSKVERELQKGLEKIFARDLIIEESMKKERMQVPKEVIIRLVPMLKYGLRCHGSEDPLWKEMEIDRNKITSLLEQAPNLSPVEWRLLIESQKKIALWRAKLRKNSTHSDTQLIEEENEKHRHRQFNIRDGWLPLHRRTF